MGSYAKGTRVGRMPAYGDSPGKKPATVTGINLSKNPSVEESILPLVLPRDKMM